MTLAPIPWGLRSRWLRAPYHGWVDAPLRTKVLAFLDAFEAEHGWVRKGTSQGEEHFAISPTDQFVRVPYGPTGPQNPSDFLQRDGLPTIICRVTRHRDGRQFECTMPFGAANETPSDLVDQMLLLVRESFRTSERASRT